MGVKPFMDIISNSDSNIYDNGSNRKEEMVKKIRFYKRLLIEVVETLITICMVLSRDSMGRGMYRNILEGHINELGKMSVTMRCGKDYENIKPE